MVSLSDITAIVLRHTRLYWRDLNLFLGILYWPILDILIWGFLGSWIQTSFFIPLFLYTIWIGFIGLLFVLLLGKRGVELGFITAWFLLPFSGTYYPIEILPKWAAQLISKLLPMSYVFHAMRLYIEHAQERPSTLYHKSNYLWSFLRCNRYYTFYLLLRPYQKAWADSAC